MNVGNEIPFMEQQCFCLVILLPKIKKLQKLVIAPYSKLLYPESEGSLQNIEKYCELVQTILE